LKRTDALWHFFATQNSLFLKETVEKVISYKLRKGEIEIKHTLNPRFLSESSLAIQAHNFEIPVEQYAAAKKRFGVKVPFQKPNEGIFFAKELLNLAATCSYYVEKHRFGSFRVTIAPFIPKKISEVYQP